jgi:hypothetical protein
VGELGGGGLLGIDLVDGLGFLGVAFGPGVRAEPRAGAGGTGGSRGAEGVGGSLGPGARSGGRGVPAYGRFAGGFLLVLGELDQDLVLAVDDAGGRLAAVDPGLEGLDIDTEGLGGLIAVLPLESHRCVRIRAGARRSGGPSCELSVIRRAGP